MKMVTQIAFANMKYHKSKNILIGIAIFLTTLLLFLVPTIGKNMIDGEFAVVNEIYPTWHALYRNVDEETVTKLEVHHKIGRYGLRSDVGYMAIPDASIGLLYFDEEGFSLYHLTLLKGKLPESENEIVVSKGILEALGQTGEIGDKIRVSYQIDRDGGLDFTQEKEFIISGFLEDSEANMEKKVYSALISQAFLRAEVPDEQIRYRFLLQISGPENVTTDDIEASIYDVADQFGIEQTDVKINDEYLMANYIDPSVVPVLAGIMLVIVVAGIITIYSIYYVSMEERIQEFGKLKAIGATKPQLRQLVLREGLTVALFAIPLGLLIGTVLSKVVFMTFLNLYQNENIMVTTMKMLLKENRFALYHWWIYTLAIVVSLVTVYLSLLHPMKIVEKVSEIEAMRYQGDNVDGKRKKDRNGKRKRDRTRNRKGYHNITIAGLTKINLTGNKRRTLITICSMGITGVFVMVIATVLSCANPVESANNSILGQYEILPIVEYGNKEHPERDWSSIQQNNPLTEELKEEIEAIDGVDYVDCFTSIELKLEVYGEAQLSIIGVPESYREYLEEGIIEGSATYDELLDGDKVVVNKSLFNWYPGIQLGDILHTKIIDGDSIYEKDMEVIAIGDYSIGFTNYNSFIMAQEGVASLGSNNLNCYYNVFADENYNVEVEDQIKEIISSSELLQMRSWKASYDEWKSSLTMISGASYAFLGILSIICIMNMVNTMINSVHVRKKELGMMQAIGMSDSQLIKMLQLEGLFYTVGTLLLSVGVGSALGYPVFLWAKENGMFSISNYHYPIGAAVTISIALLVIQIILAFVLGRSVRKQSLIERIRFSE